MNFVYVLLVAGLAAGFAAPAAEMIEDPTHFEVLTQSLLRATPTKQEALRRAFRLAFPGGAGAVSHVIAVVRDDRSKSQTDDPRTFLLKFIEAETSGPSGPSSPEWSEYEADIAGDLSTIITTRGPSSPVRRLAGQLKSKLNLFGPRDAAYLSHVFLETYEPTLISPLIRILIGGSVQAHDDLATRIDDVRQPVPLLALALAYETKAIPIERVLLRLIESFPADALGSTPSSSRRFYRTLEKKSAARASEYRDVATSLLTSVYEDVSTRLRARDPVVTRLMDRAAGNGPRRGTWSDDERRAFGKFEHVLSTGVGVGQAADVTTPFCEIALTAEAITSP